MNLKHSRVNSLLFTVAALFATPSAHTQTGPSFSITGIVVSSTTGAPVPHCHLAAAKVERTPSNLRRTPQPQQDGVDTDDRGHFTLPLPTAGRWSLRASARGYRPQFYDQHEAFSSTIVLTPQQPSYDLRFRLAPDSAITGVILDEGSEPIRQAQISVFAVPREGSEGSQANRSRQFATTDDRGRYEVDGLAPGDYRISVSARPWYAQASQVYRPQPDTPSLEPSLDVVYPVTWYPGGTSEETAETLTLHDGETRQADLQLSPIPSVHLRIPLPPSEPPSPGTQPRPIRYPQVSNITGNGFAGMSISANNQTGMLDVGGLSPGTYRVQLPDENGRPGRSTLVEITANSAHTLDFAAAANTATVHLSIEGGPGTESVPITFVDAKDERKVFRAGPLPSQGHIAGILGGPLPPQSASNRRTATSPATQQPPAANAKPATSADHIVELPPGNYLVYQGGSANFSLSGLTLGTQDIPGRMVTIPSGESSLTVHIATGRSTVTGLATLDGKPVAGAMVVLVPTTVNQPGTIAEPRRDQTNTDGSFDLTAVIPGQYILIAIDHGWNINWIDPAALSHYLANGIPLDLRTPATLTQNILAQHP